MDMQLEGLISNRTFIRFRKNWKCLHPKSSLILISMNYLNLILLGWIVLKVSLPNTQNLMPLSRIPLTEYEQWVAPSWKNNKTKPASVNSNNNLNLNVMKSSKLTLTINPNNNPFKSPTPLQNKHNNN